MFLRNIYVEISRALAPRACHLGGPLQGAGGARQSKAQSLKSKIRSNCWCVRMYTVGDMANISQFIS